jgi:hypothetical protein
MNEHRQVAVKVNAQADEGVAPLVEALSAVPNVITTSSCEGDEDRGVDAWVAFVVGEDWRELGEFVRALSTALGRDDSVNDQPFTLSVEWYAGGNTPAGYLRMPRQHVTALAESIRSAASVVAEVTNACRTLPCLCDTERTGSHSSTGSRPHRMPAPYGDAHASSHS